LASTRCYLVVDARVNGFRAGYQAKAGLDRLPAAAATGLPARGRTPVSQRVAVDVPGDLQGRAAYFWKVTNDGREIHMVIHQDERGPESGQMDERIFEYRGVQLSTVLRYRVP